MTTIQQQFQTTLDEVLSKTSGATVGASAGYCRLDATNPVRGIVYAGRVEPRGPRPIIAEPGPNTLWEIGSVTKTFTATLLALKAASVPELLTAGVEPDIRRWLPEQIEPPKELATITYNRLVSMWAGLVNSNREGLPGPDFPVADMLAHLLSSQSYTEQPYTWLYSDLSLALLGWALTQIYGVAPDDPAELPQAYLALLSKELLEPLGIHATWAHDANPEQLPVGWDGDERTTRLDRNWPAADPAGALTLTAPDLLRWLESNLAPGPLLTGSVLQLLRTPMVPTGKQIDTIGGGIITTGGASCRGWFLIPSRTASETWLYNKNGRVSGFQAGLAYAPPSTLDGTSQAGVFVTINDSAKTVDIEGIAEKLLAIAVAGNA